MQLIFDDREIQKVQNRFCTLTHLFACCLDESGKVVTSMSGDSKAVSILEKHFDEKWMQRLAKKIRKSPFEDIIVEKTEYDNIRAAAVGVSYDEGISHCWIFFGVLLEGEYKNPLLLPVEGITEEHFFDALDLCVDIIRKMVRMEIDFLNAKVENERSQDSRSELSGALRRTEAIATVIQYLDSNDSFEDTCEGISKIVGQFLQTSAVKVYQVCREYPQNADCIANWTGDIRRKESDFSQTVERGQLIGGDSPVIISADHAISTKMRAEMKKFRMQAFMSFPIFVNGKVAMYFVIIESASDRTWQLEEVKFAKNVTKILQSLLSKRIQKNSLQASYASVQEIMNNVGTCIYVKDKLSGKTLFANKSLRSSFEHELEAGTFDLLLATAKNVGVSKNIFEIEQKERGRFYDLYQKEIPWIDGRNVDLYALYDITDKKTYQKRIEQQAYTDFLTGLYNRMCCEKDLAILLDRCRKEKRQAALLYIDLDDFKHINDGLGHQYGDVLLESVSHAFQRVKGMEHSCYRMGGDEFVMIVAPEYMEELESIIDSIKMISNRPWYLKDADYYCTMSMGYCIFPDENDTVDSVIQKADIAMYSAKKNGKNGHALYTDKLEGTSNKRLDMEKNMRDATSHNCNEFTVFYQPIIDVTREDKPCVGAEALVRWNSVALGFISPADFIPLAEYLGLITPIGTFVLREACMACRKWNINGHPEFKVNVNLSVVQLLQNDIREVIETAIKDTGIDPHNLTLEVTESLAINDMARMKKVLSGIKELGVRIALDDFGSGYSSLNHIRELPLDTIKVDQSFVKELAEDEYSQSFIKMVGELAEAIDVDVCVEGIETKEQVAVLRNKKIRMIQGYYFDRPLQRVEFENKYVYMSQGE